MSRPDRTTNPQADVTCPVDVVVGLTRHDQPDGSRRIELRPGPATYGPDGLPAPGLLFFVADTVVGAPCVRIVEPTDVIVTSSMHIELYSRPFAGRPMVESTTGPAYRYHGGAGSAALVRSGDAPVAMVSGRFAVLPNTMRAAGSIGEQLPFDYAQFTGAMVDTLGAQVQDRTRDSLRMTFRSRPELANERQGLHGGCAALMGERACDDLLRSVAADGHDVQLVAMNASFFRPIAADDRDLLCTVAVQHAGRQLLAAQAVLHTQDGKPAIVVDVMASGVAR